MKHFFWSLACLCTVTLAGQYASPEPDFGPPLDIPIILAGTFGELRSNHFHSGIDIKTQQREGLPVYAVQDGTVSRVKVGLWGYGKVVYIAHPNGYTSVYGHLQKFGPEIEAFVNALQYKNRSYEVEAFPEYGQLTVRKGDLIAYSGNTGGSSGPHLHFEIRNSLDEKPTNPLLYGLEVRDATNPTLEGLYAYPLSENARVNQSEVRVEIGFSRQADGTFLADPVTATGTIGFGIKAYDRQDMAANKNGLFRIRQSVNGQLLTDLDFEQFSFGETRLINTLIDYPYYARYQSRIQKCFRDAGNTLSLYKALANEGKLDVQEGLSYQVEISLTDLAGNETLVRIPVQGQAQQALALREQAVTPYYVRADKPIGFELGRAKVFFPAGSFYHDAYLDLGNQGDTVRLHEPTLALDRSFTLSIDVADIPEAERSQLFIARLGARDRAEYYNTYKRANTFSIRTRDLGRYTLARDTVPPTIRPKNFKPRQWLTHYRYLSLEISDDLSGIAGYSATLNGEWILMEYEPKTRTLTYAFDDRTGSTPQCDLEVEVTDNVGNSTLYKATVFRKP